MPRHVFSALLLLLICAECRPAHCRSVGGQGSVVLFASGKKTESKKTGAEAPAARVEYFESPFLLAADDVLIALAEAHYVDENGNANSEIVSRYIGTQRQDWVRGAMAGNGSRWRTQLAMRANGKRNEISVLRKPLAVVKDNKIYLLAVKYKEGGEKFGRWEYPDWDFELSVGEIMGEEGGGKTIKWQKSKSLNATLTRYFDYMLLYLPPYEFGGSAFLTKMGEIVFVVKAKQEYRKQAVSTVVHLKDTGKELELLYVGTSEDCYSPSFFEWRGRLVMITDCQGDKRKMKWSADMGWTWSDAATLFPGLLDNVRDKTDFITAIIENKNVLLYTQTRNTGTAFNIRREVHLFFTDGTRVYDVGPIFFSGRDIFFKGLLYTKGELFVFFRLLNEEKGLDSIFLTRLKKEVEVVKSVLKIWTEEDDYVSSPCSKTTPPDATLNTLCRTPLPTAQLVGFLSNTSTDDVWHDEYLYVNATVKGGTKVDGGFRFIGASAGAQWSVGQRRQGQWYDFAKYGITVVATVTIHLIPKNDSPLLTIAWAKSNKRLGLWYRRDKQWDVKFKNKEETLAGGWVSNKTWELKKMYRVALTLQNHTLSVYANGEAVGEGFWIPLPGEELHDIEHLFIGGYEDDRTQGDFSDVTVINVFLYNRPFYVMELGTLGTTVGDSYKFEAYDDRRKFCPCTCGRPGGFSDDFLKLCRHLLINENNTAPAFP